MSEPGESWEFGYEYQQGFFPEAMLPPDDDDYMRLEAAVEVLAMRGSCMLLKSYGYNLDEDISIEFGNRYMMGEGKLRPYIGIRDENDELTCELELNPQKELKLDTSPQSALSDIQTAIDSELLNDAEKTAARYLQSMLMYKFADLSFDRFVDRHGMYPDEARRLAYNLVDVAVSAKDVQMLAFNSVPIAYQDWVGNVLVRTNSEGAHVQDEPWIEIDIESLKQRNMYEFLLYTDDTARLEVMRIDDTLNYHAAVFINGDGSSDPESSIAEEMITFLELFTVPFKQDIQFLAELLENAEVAEPYGPPSPDISCD